MELLKLLFSQNFQSVVLSQHKFHCRIPSPRISKGLAERLVQTESITGVARSDLYRIARLDENIAAVTVDVRENQRNDDAHNWTSQTFVTTNFGDGFKKVSL